MLHRALRLPLQGWRAGTRSARLALCALMAGAVGSALAAQGVPDGQVDWARYAEPTTRYPHGVLGDDTTARTVWTEARDVFGADSAAMQVLTEAARSAGVLE